MSLSSALFFQEQSQKSRGRSVTAHCLHLCLQGSGLAGSLRTPPPPCGHPALFPTFFPWEREGGGQGRPGRLCGGRGALPSAQQEAFDLGAQVKMAPPGDSASRGVALLSPVRGTSLPPHTVRSTPFPPGFALGHTHLPVQCSLAARLSTAAPSDGRCFPAVARACPSKSGSPQRLRGPGCLSPCHP